jgi:hypothetical protein
VFERFTEQAHLLLDVAREEAERLDHRYLGPEHVLLGVLAEGHSRAAQVLGAHGVELAVAQAELLGLAGRGLVPTPRPSDAELLDTLGIDLDAVRRNTEQAYGFRAVREATWRVTRRRGWRGGRVVWTPLCGPPFFAKRALQLASEQASALGHGEIGAVDRQPPPSADRSTSPCVLRAAAAARAPSSSDACAARAARTPPAGGAARSRASEAPAKPARIHRRDG